MLKLLFGIAGLLLPAPAFAQSPSAGPQAVCGFKLGPAIFARWQSLSQSKIFGCALNSEGEATASLSGTTGRWAQFLGSPGRQGGMIFAVTSGANAGRTYEVNGCISVLYQEAGSSGGIFGFPTSDEHDAPEGRRGDFENGYIAWDATSGRCTAHPGAAQP